MYRRFFKRFFDLVFAFLAFPVFLLLVIVFSPVIFFEDFGPIFYISHRLGKNGKVFRMYKFRSMKVNAPDIRNKDGSTFNSENDPRLTQIGRFLRKTSIDEIPQILNVLRGDMSFIGPRPDLPEHRNLYILHESRKLEIRPGITGYNQAFYRNAVPWKQKIRHDIYYIDNLSIGTDIKIFTRTIYSVLKNEKVYI